MARVTDLIPETPTPQGERRGGQTELEGLARRDVIRGETQRCSQMKPNATSTSSGGMAAVEEGQVKGVGAAIFKPYRALGEVCTHVPVRVQYR